jgi:hypothetical protein
MIRREEQERTCLESMLAKVTARFVQAGEQIMEESKVPNWPTEVKIKCLEDSFAILIQDLTHE